MADTYMVNLSVPEAAARIRSEIENGSLTGELIDFHQVQLPGAQCVVMVYEKYYYRVNNRLTLTVALDDAQGRTQVHAISGGGGEGVLFRFDWGASDSFAAAVQRALQGYLL